MIRIVMVLLLASAAADPDALIREGKYEEAREALARELEVSTTPGERARIHGQIGLSYLNEGRWWEAESSFARSLEQEDSGEIRLLRGRAYFGAGRDAMSDGTALGAEIRSLMNDAATELRRAVALLPKSAEARIALALAERYRGDTEAEVTALRAALKLSPGDPAACIHLAWRLGEQGDYEGASDLLLSVPEAKRTADHWKRLGGLQVREEKLDAAAESYTRAALIDPKDWAAFGELWNATARRKQFEAFNQAMSRVLEAHPKAWLPHYYLGFSRLDDGMPEESVREFELAAEQNPELMRARVMVAEVLLTRLGNEEKAVGIYREVLRKEPENERARAALIDLAMRRARDGKHEAAGALFEVLREADPSNPVHRMNLALTKKELGRFDEALALYVEAEAEFPFEPQIPNDRGLLLMGLGRHDEAFAAFRKALSRDDEFLDTLENLGAYARLAGDYEAALRWFETARKRVLREGGDDSKFRRYLDLVNGEKADAR